MSIDDVELLAKAGPEIGLTKAVYFRHPHRYILTIFSYTFIVEVESSHINAYNVDPP